LNTDNLSEEIQGKIADELAIISEDTSSMENVLNFLDDENTAERLAQKYTELGNVDNAKQIQEQYPDNEVINDLVVQAEESQQRQDIEQQITSLEEERTNLEDADEDNQEDIDDINTQIDELNNQLNALNDEE